MWYGSWLEGYGFIVNMCWFSENLVSIWLIMLQPGWIWRVICIKIDKSISRNKTGGGQFFNLSGYSGKNEMTLAKTKKTLTDREAKEEKEERDETSQQNNFLRPISKWLSLGTLQV